MSASAPFSVHPVSTAAQARDFYQLRREIYRGNEVVVFPLKSMEKLQLDTQRHPFYQHASREMFVCYRDGCVVGRIVAIKDDLHNQQHGDRVGFFGFFEAIDDQVIVDALIDTAADWLKKQGCDSIRGPVNPSMKSDFGVLVEGTDEPPMIMTGYTLQRYEDQLKTAGLTSIKRFLAFKYISDPADTKCKKWIRLQAAKQKILTRYPNLELRTVSAENFDETMRDVNKLGNKVRSLGWGFVPLTPEELNFMIKNLRRVIRYDTIHVAYWDGQLVGYIVTIPDINWALKRAKGRFDWMRMLQMPRLIKKTPYGRVIALGVDDQFRKKGIAILLIQELVENFSAFEKWEFSWVDEANLKSIRAIGRTLPLLKSRVYELFEKTI
jgi:GNAT superfamily N-acetyltransferase